jgi:hypothetical protein
MNPTVQPVLYKWFTLTPGGLSLTTAFLPPSSSVWPEADGGPQRHPAPLQDRGGVPGPPRQLALAGQPAAGRGADVWGGAGGVLKLEQARYRERSLRRCYTSPDASTTTSAWGVCVCFDSLCTFSLRCSLAPIPFSSPSSLLVFSSLLSALLRCFLFSFLPSDACRTEPMPKILPLVCLGLFPSLPPSRSLLSLPLVL